MGIYNTQTHPASGCSRHRVSQCISRLKSSHMSWCKWDTIKMGLQFHFKTINSVDGLHTVGDIVPYNWGCTAERTVTIRFQTTGRLWKELLVSRAQLPGWIVGLQEICDVGWCLTMILYWSWTTIKYSYSYNSRTGWNHFGSLLITKITTNTGISNSVLWPIYLLSGSPFRSLWLILLDNQARRQLIILATWTNTAQRSAHIPNKVTLSHGLILYVVVCSHWVTVVAGSPTGNKHARIYRYWIRTETMLSASFPFRFSTSIFWHVNLQGCDYGHNIAVHKQITRLFNYVLLLMAGVASPFYG